MNIKLPESQTFEQYKQYANSAIHVNRALQNELSNCYDKIPKMIKEATETEKIKEQQQQQIIRLNSIIESKQNYKIIQSFRHFVSTYVQTEFQQNAEMDVNSYYQIQRDDREQILNYEIQQLLLSKLEVQIELEIARMQNVENVPQQNNCSKYQNQIHHIAQKNAELLNQNQCLFQQLNFIKVQHNKLFEQSSSRIHQLNQRIKLLENELENAKLQTIKIRYSEQPILQNQDTKVKESNVRKIHELQEKNGLLEAQNRHLRDNIRQNEKKMNQNIQIKQQTVLENQIKIIKQQYSRVMKQNMNYIQINSKLQKNSVLFSKQLQLLRRQKSQLTLKIKQLMLQIDQSNHELIKSQNRNQQLSSTLSLRQSQCFNMKRSLNSEMLQKLGVNIRSNRDLLTSRRRDTSQVPVRDSSTVSKSKSSTKVISVREVSTLRKL